VQDSRAVLLPRTTPETAMSQRKTTPTARYFTDHEGRGWKVELTPRILAAIKNDTHVDIAALIDRPEELMAKLGESMSNLGLLLWIFCEEQATRRKITTLEFTQIARSHSIPERFAQAVVGAIADRWPRSLIGLGFKSMELEKRRGKRTG
jgi:hypothetical protein